MYLVNYESSIHTVILKLDGILFPEEYKTAWLSALDLMNTKHTNRFLIDARKHKAISLENQCWFKKEFLEIAHRKAQQIPDLPKVARINSPNIDNIEAMKSINRQIEESNYSFEYLTFDQYQDALEWLFEENTVAV
ncbi:hypothetical protein [uncultured Microscilla sp.]|uniref:hypothetical protein n=1 Tax=uncultured Microscilla sp. TaxID=432653 RepID=UPI002607F672|nr:hypothetical protein [uncultured Microscilla sp.]